MQVEEKDQLSQEMKKVNMISSQSKEEHNALRLESMKQDKGDEMQGVSMDEASSPIEDKDCASSISTASLSEPMPHTLSHSYSSSHMSQYSPTYKHLHPTVNHLAYTHDGEGMQYASLEDRFPFLKDDRKRTRKLLSPEQTRILEAILERTIYPSTPLREAVARQLGIPPRKVQIWFQNKRQGRRRVSGPGEEDDDMEISRTNSANGIQTPNDEGEEEEEEEESGEKKQSGPNPPPVRERCIEVHSAADDMRLARLRDEYGRQFAELKIAPAYCDGDMYPAPHLGQFERYGGSQTQSGDHYEHRQLSSALPSPVSAPPHSGNYPENDYAAQRRHTMPLHPQQAGFPHRMESEMHHHRGWQGHYGAVNWHGNHVSRSPAWDRSEQRPSHEEFPFDVRHPSHDPRESSMQRYEHVQILNERHFAQNGDAHLFHVQRTPSYGPLSGQARAAYPHRFANSQNELGLTLHRSEQEMAYEARRRGLSTAPVSAPYPLLRSYSHNNPYDRPQTITHSEAMHRSYTSFSQGLYPPNAPWNAARPNNHGNHGMRHHMPPPLSPAERPHTPGSSRGLRSFFPDHAGIHRDRLSNSPHKLQIRDRIGRHLNPSEEKRSHPSTEKKDDTKANEEGKDEDGRINDAYERAKRMDGMPSAESSASKNHSGATSKMASLADVALRHKSRLPPLRIPSSMNNFKTAMDENSKDEKMTKEDCQIIRQVPRSLSSDDIRYQSSMEKSSPMALDAAPSSPQSAREMRMTSPSNSQSPVTPTHRHADLTPFAKSAPAFVNDRQETLPSITELMRP